MLVQLTNAVEPHVGEPVSVNPEAVASVRRGAAEYAEFTLVAVGLVNHRGILVVQEPPGVVHAKLTAALATPPAPTD